MRVIVMLKLLPGANGTSSVPVGITVYAHADDGRRSCMSAREVSGTVTFCSPAS